MQASIESKIIQSESKQFPKQLRNIPDPPSELYLAGKLPETAPVAIVGSRKATAYGRRVTQVLAARLAAAAGPVVSGLAFGIDAIAHRAALDAGGTTIAVLPCGINRRVISPRSNLALADDIVARGALVSEYPPETAARKEAFLARNRLISGLARVVVVVEAALPSGSLITAKHATDQGKDVWAVPGQIDSETSRGTNALIEQGAFPLTNIEYFLEAIGVISEAYRRTDHPVLKLITEQPRHIDAVADVCGRSVSELEAELTKLEIVGLIRHLGGRYYVRA